MMIYCFSLSPMIVFGSWTAGKIEEVVEVITLGSGKLSRAFFTIDIL